MDDTNQDRRQPSMIPVFAILGCFVVGVAGLFGAIFSTDKFNDATGGGVCLVASAIAFGLAANAVFRK